MVRPELGLVCITSTKAIRYRAITRTQFLALRKTDRRRRLRELYQENLRIFGQALDFCASERIQLYRVTSGLFPFSDLEIGRDLIEGMRKQIREQGNCARTLGIRVVTHPDQYVVLNSDSAQVVTASRRILGKHALMFDAFGFERSPWAAIQIHGGKRDRSEALIRAIDRLDDSIRTRLVLENDEKAYGAREILGICRSSGRPMVFDAHHHVVHEGLDSYDHPSVEQAFGAAATTWNPRDWQLVHISNGREFFGDPRHSDFVSIMPRCFATAPWIEVEAKLKEQAIRKIRAGWASKK